jgi:hypothetical protein
MSDTTLQRLLNYPHAAVFDKDPLAELVIRVRHDSGCAWTVAAGVMAITAGVAVFEYQLADHTVGSLADAMEADGFDVLRVNSAYWHLSALALVEGSNDQWVSNGDHLRVFTSLMWALLQGYSREVDEAQEQIRQALLQMIIATAEGEWLSLWGDLYGVPRTTGETDAALRLRIPREAFRLRVNPRAIEAAIKELTGKDVVILEPWQDVFTLDQSLLSGPDKTQDGDRVGPFLIQPYSAIPIDWSDVLPIIERCRPAGVISLPPKGRIGTSVAFQGDYSVAIEVRRRHTGVAVIEDMALLDVSDIEDVSVPNDPFLRRTKILNLLSVEYVGQTFVALPWRDETWASQAMVVNLEHSSTTTP